MSHSYTTLNRLQFLPICLGSLVAISRRIVCAEKKSAGDISYPVLYFGTGSFQRNNQDRRTFWTDDQTSPLLGPTVNCFNDVNQLLLILQHPVQLIVVSRSKIAHLYIDQHVLVDTSKTLGIGPYHVLIAEKEHERHGIV